MKAPKITQGEWEVIEVTKVPIGVGTVEHHRAGDYTTLICNSILPDDGKVSKVELKTINADMKLIAAAPDMAKALVLMLDQFQLMIGYDSESDAHALTSAIDALLKAGYTE